MIKRCLLAASIAVLNAQQAMAAPFLQMNARGLAMGNTGVASAQRAHAPAYNPSLLSQAKADDDFAILIKGGIDIADEEGLVNKANDIKEDIFPDFEKLIKNDQQGGFAQKVEDLAAAADQVANALNFDNVTNISQKSQEIRTASTNFSDKLTAVDNDIGQLKKTTQELTKALDNISGNPLRSRTGASGAIAFPGKQFAAAVSLSGDIHLSGRAFFTKEDQNLLNGYASAAKGFVDNAQGLAQSVNDIATIIEQGGATSIIRARSAAKGAKDSVQKIRTYESEVINTAAGETRIFRDGKVSQEAKDINLNSQVQVKAASIAELGLSLSREFEILGQAIAIGVTPKLQMVHTFQFISELDNKDKIDDQEIRDSLIKHTSYNLDAGASYRFGSSRKWMFGLVVKNLVSRDFEVKDTKVKGSNNNEVVTGGVVSVDTQYRAGLAFNGDWTTVAADLDLAENKPVAYERATQYAAIGAEFNVFDILQLRTGYRNNLKGTNDHMVSIGAGLSPFGVHLDVALMANPSDPKREAGIALDAGFYF